MKSKRGTQFRIWAKQILREHLLRGCTIRQPISEQHLQEMKQNIERQIADLRHQIERMNTTANEKYYELYQMLIKLTTQKQQDDSSRKKIGYQRYIDENKA